MWKVKVKKSEKLLLESNLHLKAIVPPSHLQCKEKNYKTKRREKKSGKTKAEEKVGKELHKINWSGIFLWWADLLQLYLLQFDIYLIVLVLPANVKT